MDLNANFLLRTPAMLHTMSADGTLLEVSQAWLDTLGYARETVIGKDFFELIKSEDITIFKQQVFEKLAEAGDLKGMTYQVIKADGGTIEMSLSVSALFDNDGSLSKCLAVLNDMTIFRRAEERIERLAYYDTLTGLPNRTLMNDRILQAVAQGRRENRQVGVFFFDLDRFKLINDTQGHAVGDLVLRSVANRLKKYIRQGDTFARLGGDEFVIVQADPNHDPNFTTMGKRILETLGKPFQIDNREFTTTASVGIAVYPMDGDDPQTLLKSADTAMYVAKSRGRNNMQFFSDEMNAEALSKANMEARLRHALNHNELQLYYQPLVNLNNGKLSGVEAVLRWPGENGELISPSETISIAEESGLIYPLGEWIMRTACSQVKQWQGINLSRLRMSINLSGHHIRQTNFIDRIEAILKESEIKPNDIEIELSENSVMGQVNESIMALTDLKIRGITLAIDDFGTGYSSLLYLKHFPIHRIKIAQEFIRDITQNQDYAAITDAILSMAKSLNLTVTAVGVEDTQQLHFLRERGCQEVQGRLIGPAMDAETITRYLSENLDKKVFSLSESMPGTIKLNGSEKVH